MVKESCPLFKKTFSRLSTLEQLWYEQFDNNLTIVEITVALCRIVDASAHKATRCSATVHIHNPDI
jgi:hypothetical protein